MLKTIVLVSIAAYRYILFPYRMFHSCRYLPTCSVYAVQAVTRYGVLRGLWHAAWRIVRCHPFSMGGIDQVR